MEQGHVLVGGSAAIRSLHDQIDRAARSNAKVLITGESGVGKEIVARLIHQRSSRSGSPLVTINCAGFPDALLESELFGHVKGSFTDAHRDKRGWLEAAHGGTIFMDEIGEMSLRMQALLLRFLETGEIQRVGSDRVLPPVDVRVIAATHRRLTDRVAEQSFRQDLYYRLNVVHLHVPPLRERCGDLPALLAYFFDAFSRAHRSPTPDVTPEALAALMAYDWPGNVRELRNVAERLVLGPHLGRVRVQDLPSEIPRDPRPARGESGHVAGRDTATARVLFDRLASTGASFWSEIYEPFMAHDLTRADVRELVRLGLERTRGNYRMLVTLFNMPMGDYKRFLAFLRKYECHVPFQRFRIIATGRERPFDAAFGAPPHSAAR